MRYFLIISILFFSGRAISQSNSDSLRKHVVKLGAFPFSRSANHVEYLDKAAEYVKSNFEYYSLETVLQKYKLNNVVYKNVIASFGPSTKPRFIVGANYDCIDNVPGADANASGIAGLVELARLLKKFEKQLIYRVDLIAYTLGEIPYRGTNFSGSYVHAKSLREMNVKVLGMINLNQIGFFTDIKHTQSYPIFIYKLMYGNRGNFIAVVQNPGNGLWGRVMKGLMKQYMTGLRVIHFKPIIPYQGLTTGDYQSYNEFGYPAIMISNTSCLRNKYYHYDVDTYETLDYFRMSKVVDMVFRSILRYKE